VALVEEQGRHIETLEADLERLQHHSNDRDDKLRNLIQELEDHDYWTDERIHLLLETMFDFRCQCGEDKENTPSSSHGVC
jgi:redox-regulated HSP33 family molecular chaperone